MTVIRKLDLALISIFYWNKYILKEKWEIAISEISYPSLYQNVTEGKHTLIDRKEKIQPMHIEPGLYPSIVNIVVAIKDK